MSNTSATGGYLLPAQQNQFGNLSITEFIQTVLVGISGLPGDLVRPKWQPKPPSQPGLSTNWLSFGLTENLADTFEYTALDNTQTNVSMRMEQLTVQCTFYGPESFDIMTATRDGFQIGQNREALQSVKMDFAYSGQAMRIPDLVNETWVDRWELPITLRREILRSYPILYVLTVNGTIYALGDSGEKTINFAARSA